VAASPAYEAVLARARDAMRRRLGDTRELERWIEIVARDPSHGAHDPTALGRLDAATPH
jgi:hypothetical protein